MHEYKASEFETLCKAHFGSVDMYGLFHARKLRAHELALKLGWDSIHPRSGLTSRFYDWFTPAIAAQDFVLRSAAEADLNGALDFIAVCRGREQKTMARSPSSCTRICPTSRASGPGLSGRSGCGRPSPTSYLPLLDLLNTGGAAMLSLTPVLCDQLEGGWGGRC